MKSNTFCLKLCSAKIRGWLWLSTHHTDHDQFVIEATK